MAQPGEVGSSDGYSCAWRQIITNNNYNNGNNGIELLLGGVSLT